MNWNNCDLVIGLQFPGRDPTKQDVLDAISSYITILHSSETVPKSIHLFNSEDQQIGYAERR